ncbi:hypothetical protein ES702_06923 [subsurface metagenome]
MEIQTKDKTGILKLDEEFFAKFFSHDIRLGEKPPDQCTDEEIMAGAIPKIWSKALEKEFEKRLWLSRYIAKTGFPAIVEKSELLENPGDKIWINRVNLLKAQGDLGTNRTLSGNEEQLSLSRVGLMPVRKGNAICWPHIMTRKVPFALKDEAKNLLAYWAAEKFEKLLLTSAASGGTVIYSGTAVDVNSITATDVLTAHDLKRAWAILSGNSAPSVDGAVGSYIALTHGWAYADLMNDPEWQSAVAYRTEKTKLAGSPFAGRFGTWMDIQVMATALIEAHLSEASPGVEYFETLVLAGRALAVAFGLTGEGLPRLRWLQKVSDWQEQLGSGCDFYIDTGILNSNSIVRIRHAATSPL